jgi:hypothetical protein
MFFVGGARRCTLCARFALGFAAQMAPIVALQVPEGVIVEDTGILASYWVEAWHQSTVKAFHTLFSNVRARQPKGCGIVMCFRTDAIDARRFGDEPTRKDLARLNGAFEGYFRNTALVIEGGGFVASALRSSTWAMSTVLRIKNVPKYFDTTDEAARHLGAALADLGATRESITRAAELAKATVTSGASA